VAQQVFAKEDDSGQWQWRLFDTNSGWTKDTPELGDVEQLSSALAAASSVSLILRGQVQAFSP
jgi:hypothetical protein